MEKYRSSADSSTGVHPFVPNTLSISVVRILLQSLLFGTVRVPVFLTGITLFFVCIPFCYVVSPVNSLCRLTCRIRDALSLRLVLFSLGVWRVQRPELQRPRMRLTDAGRHPGHGDMIYSNHCSYLDVLYLGCVYSPVFVWVSAKGKVFTYSLMQAIRAACRGNVGARTKTEIVNDMSSILSNASRYRKGPVVVFAEGTTTNGKGVLQFTRIKHAVEEESSFLVYALGIRYSNTKEECFTVGSLAKHVLYRVGSVSSTVRAKITAIPPDGNPQLIVATLGGVPALKIDSSTRKRFEEHWKETQSGVGGYAKDK